MVLFSLQRSHVICLFVCCCGGVHALMLKMKFLTQCQIVRFIIIFWSINYLSCILTDFYSINGSLSNMFDWILIIGSKINYWLNYFIDWTKNRFDICLQCIFVCIIIIIKKERNLYCASNVETNSEAKLIALWQDACSDYYVLIFWSNFRFTAIALFFTLVCHGLQTAA